jgi:hypothetical protein
MADRNPVLLVSLLNRHFWSGAIAAARTPDGVSPKRRRNARLKWETSQLAAKSESTPHRSGGG